MTWLSLSVVARAGLGPAGVVVLYNAEDPDAVEVANAYAAARAVPLQHLCGLPGIDPLDRDVDWATFELLVRAPFEACLAALPQPDDIDTLVTVRGLPYTVTLGTGTVGLEAALQVGRGVDLSDAEVAGQDQVLEPSLGVPRASVLNPEFVGAGAGCDPADLLVDNPYRAPYRATCALQGLEELPRGFRRSRDHAYGSWDFTGQLLVVGRLDGFGYDDALELIDRSVASDGTFPEASFLCMAGGDEARAARDPECELATRRLDEAGFETEWVPAHDDALSGRTVVGYMTGADELQGAIDGLTYAPGAIACNLTSYGALPQNFFCDALGTTCPEDEAQTSIARFVRAGATGVHGTVAEPLNNSFPGAGAMVLYASGYTLGESFLYASEYLYWVNLVLGDPLAAPYAERPAIGVPGGTNEGEPLVVTADHPQGVDEIRLYIDDVLVATAEGARLEYEHGRKLGDRIPVLVVAVAAHGEAERPGWPAGSQTVRAETQGWRVASVPVFAAAGSAGTPPEDEKSGCGCATGPGPQAWLGLAAFVSAGSRRTAGSRGAPRRPRPTP